MNINFVEVVADEDEMYPAKCKYGNIIAGHACYCHHEDGPRKCPQWRTGEPWEDCEMFEMTQEKNWKER